MMMVMIIIIIIIIITINCIVTVVIWAPLKRAWIMMMSY